MDSSVGGVPSSPRKSDTSGVTAWQQADTVGTNVWHKLEKLNSRETAGSSKSSL